MIKLGRSQKAVYEWLAELPIRKRKRKQKVK